MLWVDDQIFDEGWENKGHMEDASSLGAKLNVHFIPKSNTDGAIAFLQSAFGKRLKKSNTFRIVTDMNRKNERPVYNAGARLIQGLRALGFKNECLVFTSNKEKANQILDEELYEEARQNTGATTRVADLRSFVNFENMSQ